PGSSRRERRGRRPVRRVDGTIGSGGILSAAILSGPISRSQPTIQDSVRADRVPRRRAAPRPYSYGRLGGVAERSNAPVLKTGVRSRGPRVRIPPPPLAGPARPIRAVRVRSSHRSGRWRTVLID